MPIEFNSGSAATAPNPAKTRFNKSLFRMGLIVLPLLFVLLLKSLVFDTALIVSGSMEPTLQIGDYLLTDHRVALRGSWKRGDIVTFISPDSWDSRGETLIKRIVGMPGEVIHYTGGQFHVNENIPVEPYIKEAPIKFGRAPVTLGPNQYWVLGDNRNNSDDSSKNGPISEGDITARAVYRLWPWNRRGSVEK